MHRARRAHPETLELRAEAAQTAHAAPRAHSVLVEPRSRSRRRQGWRTRTINRTEIRRTKIKWTL